MQNQPEQNQQIQIKASDEVLKGVYANLAQVAHSGEEFILDFMNVFPPAGNLVSRVLVSPAHAKRFSAALVDNLKKYEEQYGEIKAGVDQQQKIGFRTE